MIPSVQERKKNVHIFMNYYPYLCRLQNIVPNPSIKIDSSNKCLDFIGDRLKLEDWKPVLEALSNDRSLHFITIRSRHCKSKVLQEAVTESEVRQLTTPKSSPLFTNYTLEKISDALSKCLSNSQALTGLVLEKIPLGVNCLNNLKQGLEVCPNLQQLSLPFTQLGDDGCEQLCLVLRPRLNLVWLNLTGCGLTDCGVSVLCKLLKYQKLNRYSESWKQSLRYRPVNPNLMPGLRRLTVNHNNIGDSGARIFVETVIDDLWLKALDLQNCGITMVGGEDLLNLVKENRFLSVVDVRSNTQVPKSVVAAIVQQLAENSCGTTPEFQWLKEDGPKSNSGSNTTVSRTTMSRSSQRLVSSTTLANRATKDLLAVLPSKPRATVSNHSQPHTLLRTRSASAKRVASTIHTPRPPWNCGNPTLRRGNSDQLITKTISQTPEIASELQSVKYQLQEVLKRLEEERANRIKIEEELEKYKEIIKPPDKPMANMEAGDTTTIQRQDSLESVIRTINGEINPALDLNLSRSGSSTNLSSDIQNSTPTTKAQQLFETLISYVPGGLNQSSK